MLLFNYSVTHKRNSIALLLFATTLLAGACAAMQPPNAGGPGPSGPPYPVVLTEQAQRREASVLALNRIAQRNGSGDLAEVHLQPVTDTIKSLPTNLASPLYLPKVGSKAEMDEEETREALRRFINNWRGLIGANPSQLSLVERIDQPDRTKIARYEQRPFRYPLRGDYGKLEIHFTADRRLLNLSSNSIPDAERLQAVLANITPRLTAEDAIKHVRDNGVEYTDSLGNQQTYKVSVNNEVNPSELVIYALSSRSADALEIYIAWEIAVSNAPFKTVYLDALNAKIVAVR
jgi:hypothetical protein